jgi:hypothetical protein
MANEFARNIKDAALVISKALPAAAADNTSDPFRIGSGISLENVELEVSIPALANLVDGKTITLELVTGATSSPATVLQQLYVATGKTGNGFDAVVKRFRLPSTCLDYIAVKQTVLTGGGDNAASSITYSLLT